MQQSSGLHRQARESCVTALVNAYRIAKALSRLAPEIARRFPFPETERPGTAFAATGDRVRLIHPTLAWKTSNQKKEPI
jgi:hypothetical protein